MKKVFLAAILVVSTLTFAQEKDKKREKLAPEQQTELQVKKMTAELDLNETQQKQVKELLESQKENRALFLEKRKEIKNSGEKPTKEEKADLMEKKSQNREAFKTKLKTILTEDQFNKWEAFVADKKEESKERKETKKKEHKKNKSNSEK
jgi:hypothetical protein